MTIKDAEKWNGGAQNFHEAKETKKFDLTFEEAAELPVFKRLIDEVAGRTVVDLGCGDGFVAVQLISAGAIVTAVDGSEVQLEKAREKHPDLPTQLVDLNEPLPFADQSFDIAISRFVLMYVENLSGLGKEVARVLKPGGKFVFTVVHPMYPYLQKMLRANSRYSGLTTYGEDVKGEIEMAGKMFPFYFRPTRSYLQPFIEAGLQLQNYQEITPTEEFLGENPQFERMRGKTVYLTLGFVLPKNE